MGQKRSLVMRSVLPVAVIFFLALIGCSFPEDSASDDGDPPFENFTSANAAVKQTGIFRLLLTDFPIKGHEVQKVYITIRSVEIHSATRHAEVPKPSDACRGVFLNL